MTDRLYPAEFVFPGHPDKLSDAIADAIVSAAAARETRALVGVEVAVHRRRVLVTGRVACEGADAIDIPNLVREVYRSAGYGGAWDPLPKQLRIDTDLCLGPLADGEAEFRELSDDQAICVGYAVDSPATQYLPIEQFLAYRLARRLHALRLQYPALQLGPDGKVIVAVSVDNGIAQLREFSASLQQKQVADEIALHRAVRVALTEELQQLAATVKGLLTALPEQLTVNGAGAFEVGGPEGDNGLSGKKLVMDAYGPRVPIGGGAWSGKDFFKADRAGGLHARRIAKLLVMTGLAKEATVTLGWRPGDTTPQIFSCEGASCEAARRCAALLNGTLAFSGEHWGRTAALQELARWGHYTDARHWWERMGLSADQSAYIASGQQQQMGQADCTKNSA